MRKFLIIAFLMLVTFPGYAGEPRTAGVQTKRDVVPTFQGRSYILREAGGTGKHPLLIALHGGGGSMNHLYRNLGMGDVAAKHGFTVAYLNGTGGDRLIAKNLRTWNGGGCCGAAQTKNIDDVSYIDEFIKEMIATKNIDPERVYMTGHSNGGIMTYRFICERPGVVAAAVPISGPLMIADCKDGQTTRVLHIHGDKDEHVFVGGGYGPRSIAKANFTSVAETQRKLTDAGADMNVLIVKGAGHSLDSINETLKNSASKSLAETIANFLDK